MKNTLILLVIIALSGCNKEKRYSQRLMNGEVFKVNGLYVDGIKIYPIYSEISFIKTDIYKEVSTATWSHKGTGFSTKIEWQFSAKGKICTINYVQLCENCDGSLVTDLDYAVYALTGAYNVINDKKKSVVLESENTIGYAGKKVRIELTKKE